VSLSCGPYGLTRTPDGTQLYATCAIAGSVQVVDLQNRTVVKSIQTTGRPRRPWASPDGLTVVVPNEGGWVDYIR
jgi:YVTN family beta-propeller protein